MSMTVDCGPLSGERAEIVRDLLKDLVSKHPLLTGFLLHGSIVGGADRLPESDEDLFFVGDPETSMNDPRLQGISLFESRGLAIHLCRYFFGDLARPETMPFVAAVSLHKAHVLWEFGGALSGPKMKVAELLEQKDWVEVQIHAELLRLDQWAGIIADTLRGSPPKPDDFFWSATNGVLSILAAANLRAPSFARKGLMEITTCSRLCGVPELADLMLNAFGAADVTPDEMTCWAGRLDDAYNAVRACCPNFPVTKHRYHVAGIRAMAEAGYHREGVWPLRRGLGECVHALESVDSTAAQAVLVAWDELNNRLAVREPADLERKASCYAEAVRMLVSNEKPLLERFRSVKSQDADWR